MKLYCTRLARPGLLAGLAIFLMASLAMLFYGRLNMDEAWYLYAGKLVYRGLLPYRDFAYTQTPLVPYVYGLPQAVLGQSLLIGRCTSLFFSLLSFLLGLVVARRYAGEAGAGLTAVFLGTFFAGIYYLTIVKTYALVTFFLMLTFFLLSAGPSNTKRASFAVAAAFLAGATRLSAMAFAAVILIVAVRAASSARARWLLAAEGLFLSLTMLLFFAANPGAAAWDLLTYHTLPWENVPAGERFMTVVVIRPLTFLAAASPYTVYILLIFLLVLLVSREPPLAGRLKAYLQQHREIPAMATGTFLFSLAHLASGRWHLEYFMPAMFVGIVILCIGCVKVHALLDTRSATKALLSVATGLVLLISPLRQGAGLLEIGNGETMIARVRRVAGQLSSFTAPGDSLIILEALWIAIESGRDTLPGYAMAQFSYWPFQDPAEARQSKLVNLDILQQDILQGQARAVILTNVDWNMIGGEGMVAVCSALRQNYSLASMTKLSEREPDTIYIYRLREGPPPPSEPAADPCMRR